MLLTNCQEDNTLQPNSYIQESKKSVTKSVSADEIPEVINFIKSKSNDKMEFKLQKNTSPKNGIRRASEEDLVMTTVITDEIQEITNSYDKSNYTFKLIEQKDLEGTYFLNLVVKEYLDSFYMYIVKYIPDPLWLNNYINELDFASFSGTLVFYNDEGNYVGQMDMFDSISTSSEFNDPCSKEDNTSTGGGGSTGDGTSGGDGGSTGTGGGGGGFDFSSCTWSIVLVQCCGSKRDRLHPPLGCGCDSNRTGTYFELTIDCGNALTMNDVMNCPEELVETCYQANGDPCTTDCDEFGNCIENPDQIENSEVIIMTDQEKLQFNKFITYSLSSEQQDWINDIENWLSRNAIFSYFKTNTYTTQAKAFAKAAIDALMDGGKVDFVEMYISINVSDSNYIYQGNMQLIPNSIILSNGDIVEVTFITYTSDGKSSNQEVAADLANGIIFALENANQNLSNVEKITSINIYATTNGDHNGPNHYNGTALDINRINGDRMAVTGLTPQIIELQKAFDEFQYIRENFGPYFKHKYSIETNTWNYNYPVSGHKDHIHVSIRK